MFSKRTILALSLVAMFLVLFGCHQNDTSQTDNTLENNNGGVSYSFEPLIFYSQDDLITAVNEINPEDDMYNLSELDFYYLPTNLISEATLDAITVKDRYVCVYYFLTDMEINDYSSADEEEIARISNTIKLEWIRNEIGEDLLRNTVEQFNLKEYSNGVFYYDISYPTQPESILAKSFFWVSEGYRFNLDVPIEMFRLIENNENSISLLTIIDKVYF
jgi:hypothetical protein